MEEVRLEEKKIKFGGEWLTSEDITKRIQEKMEAGDMRFADLASALETLNTAIENSKELEIKLVIPKAEYEKLKILGGDDDTECIKKAIRSYIGATPNRKSEPAAPVVDEKKKTIVKCAKCKHPIEIFTDERPLDIECPNCGTSGRLKAKGA